MQIATNLQTLHPSQHGAPNQMISPVLLNRRQVAAMLGVCERTVFTLTKNGELKCRKIGDKSVRYRPEDVQEFARRESH